MILDSMKDLSALVNAQGETIDTIDANMAAAEVHVAEGTKDVLKVRSHTTPHCTYMTCVLG